MLYLLGNLHSRRSNTFKGLSFSLFLLLLLNIAKSGLKLWIHWLVDSTREYIKKSFQENTKEMDIIYIYIYISLSIRYILIRYKKNFPFI